MSKLLPLMLACISGLGIQPAIAGTSGLDEQFGSAGIVLLGPTPVSALKIDRTAGLAVRDDGKIMLGGRFYDATHGTWLAAVGRLNADASWDASFGDHGLFVLPYGSAAAPLGGEIHEVAMLSDHSVIASGGTLTAGGFRSCTLLVKVDDTGALSATFAPDHSGAFCYDFSPSGSGYHQNSHNEGLVVDAADAFYVTSTSTNLNHGAVAHFDKNGAPITNYGNNGVAALPLDIFAGLALLTSNDVLAVGVSSLNLAIHSVRLDATGTVVSAYGSNGVFTFDQQVSPAGVGPMQATLDSNHNLLIADNDYDGASNLPYRFARLTDAGAFDTSFNGSSQQPGYPGFAFPVVSGDPNQFVVAVQPLADGDILAIGNASSELALLRLNNDSGYDGAFGDAAHPGWAAINALGTGTSITQARALTLDGAGHVLAAIDVADGLIGCPGLIRVVADRLFDDRFDSPPTAPTCP